MPGQGNPKSSHVSVPENRVLLAVTAINISTEIGPKNAARPGTGRRIFGSILHQGISNFSGSITSLIVVPLVIKTSGAATYGIFVLLNSVLVLSAQAFSLGAGYKARRQLPVTSDRNARARIFIPNFSFQIITYGAATMALTIALPAIDGLLFGGKRLFAVWVVPLGMIATFLNYLSDDYFRYTQRMTFISLSALARAAIYIALVAGISSGLHSLSPNQLFFAQSTGTIIPALALWWYLSKEIPLRFRLDSWKEHWWDIRYGLPLTSAILIENFLSASDRYILAGFLSPVHVGAYAAAAAVGGLILLLPKVISAVLPAALSHAVDSGGRKEAQLIFNQVLRFYLIVAAPFVAGAALLGRPLLALFANEQVASLAHWVVPIMAFGSALYGYTWLVFSAIFVQMNTRLWFKANVLAGIIALVLTIISVKIFHRIEFAAIALVIGYAASTTVIVTAGSHDWPLRLDRAILTKTLPATTIMALAIWLVGHGTWLTNFPRLTLACQLASGAAIYLGILCATGAVTRADVRHIFSKN